MKPDPFLMYDFEKDEWVEPTIVHPKWNTSEHPNPDVKPEEGKWHALPGKLDAHDWLRIWLRPRLESRHAAWLALVCVSLILFGAVIANLPFFLCGLAGLVVLVIYMIVTSLRPSIPYATDHDKRLLEDPTDIDVCLVEVTIWRRDQPVGKDRGVVWFSEGRLLFNGRHTSFAIGGEDVLPESQWPKALHNKNMSGYLPLRTGLGPAGVMFEVLPFGHPTSTPSFRFSDRFRTFRRRPPKSRAPRQWPPFEAPRG